MLQILVISDTYPNRRNRTSVLFENIMPILGKKSETKILWLSYGEKEKVEIKNSNYEVFHISDFKTSKEVLEKTRPSLIYLIPGTSIIEQTFLITAKIAKIPTFQWAVGIPFFAPNRNKKRLLREFIRQFFEKKQGFDYKSNLRGVSFMKNIIFFVKSSKILGKNYFQIFSELLQEIKIYVYLGVQKNFCDLILVENKLSYEFLKKHDFPENKMVITGDPTFDFTFEKEKEFDSIKDKKKLQVLFLTVNMTSGQGGSTWTITKRNEMIKELISEYKKFKNNFSLSIKIHPTNEYFADYKKLVDSYKINIPIFQKESIFELVAKSDVILTTSASTAATIALIMKKPVIIWNYFHTREDLFLENGVAMNCNSALKIKDCLTNAISFFRKNEYNINEFVRKITEPKNASQNIANAIEELMLKNEPN